MSRKAVPGLNFRNVMHAVSSAYRLWRMRHLKNTSYDCTMASPSWVYPLKSCQSVMTVLWDWCIDHRGCTTTATSVPRLRPRGDSDGSTRCGVSPCPVHPLDEPVLVKVGEQEKHRETGMKHLTSNIKIDFTSFPFLMFWRYGTVDVVLLAEIRAVCQMQMSMSCLIHCGLLLKLRGRVPFWCSHFHALKPGLLRLHKTKTVRTWTSTQSWKNIPYSFIHLHSSFESNTSSRFRSSGSTLLTLTGVRLENDGALQAGWVSIFLSLFWSP